MRPLRRALRDLAGRSHGTFIELLEIQIDAGSKGASLIGQAVGGDGFPAIGQTMDAIEADGDDARSALAVELARAVSTPIDREDLFRLSRSIDDVLDNLRDFARELELYRPARTELFPAILDAVTDAFAALRDAVGVLGSLEKVPEAAKRAGKASNEVRRRYERAVAELFDRPMEMEVLRERELLRRLDVAGLRLHEAADALADGAWKRNQ